jgi:hypothetical protein
MKISTILARGMAVLGLAGLSLLTACGSSPHYGEVAKPTIVCEELDQYAVYSNKEKTVEECYTPPMTGQPERVAVGDRKLDCDPQDEYEALVPNVPVTEGEERLHYCHDFDDSSHGRSARPTPSSVRTPLVRTPLVRTPLVRPTPSSVRSTPSSVRPTKPNPPTTAASRKK